MCHTVLEWVGVYRRGGGGKAGKGGGLWVGVVALPHMGKSVVAEASCIHLECTMQGVSGCGEWCLSAMRAQCTADSTGGQHQTRTVCDDAGYTGSLQTAVTDATSQSNHLQHVNMLHARCIGLWSRHMGLVQKGVAQEIVCRSQ